jgi:hypothetical protein
MVAPMQGTTPERMRQAMADFVAAVHEAYLAQARLLPPAEQARLPLLAARRLTVAAAGARNLHVIGTGERFPAPVGQEVELTGEADGLAWDLRFFDPVVLPVLGLVAEADGPAPEEVRRVLGVGTTAGLVRAQALLARELAPGDPAVAAATDPPAIRAALLKALGTTPRVADPAGLPSRAGAPEPGGVG